MKYLIIVTCFHTTVFAQTVIWYDGETLPQVIQGMSGLYPLDYNLAGNLDKTGSANNEFRWRHTGGLDHCGPEVDIKRRLSIPKGKHIRLYRRRLKKPLNHPPVAMGVYPNGTIAAEFLFDRGRLFEVRSRTKVSGEWITDQQEFGDKPRGYVKVDNCVDCHSDVGRHSLEIDPNRDWYATIRGLEKGGPIHWHPFRYTFPQSHPYGPIRVEIRDEVKSFVEWYDE